MSDVDDKLDAAWRAASREEPPVALDDALRAAARRAVGAGPSRARHMQSWPLAAAAVVAVLAIGIVQMTPPEQVAPTIVADSAPRQAASKEKDMTAPAAAPAPRAAPATMDAAPRVTEQVAAAPAPVDRVSGTPRRQLVQPSNSPSPPNPSLALADKPQAPSGAGALATGAIAPVPERDGGALKSKLETTAAEEPAKKARAEPFPAAPAEAKNAADALVASPPPALAAAKPAPAPMRENAIEARTARRDEAPAAQAVPPAAQAQTAGAAAPTALAKVAPERERAKDSAPRTPDEWIKLIRRLQNEGRKEEVTKELAAFRAAYKERADALLPADLRETK
jgi:hypothetical protein